MKKLVLSLAVIAGMSFFACGSSDKQAADADSTAVEEVAVEETVVEVADSAAADSAAVVADSAAVAE